MAPTKQMSHAEMWDDSALVNSWNVALEEYKKYHSIEACNEDVQEVLKRAQGEESNSRSNEGEEMEYEEGADEPFVNDPHAKRSVPEQTADHNTTSMEEHTPVATNSEELPISVPEPQPSHQQAQASVRSPPVTAPPALPQQLIGQVHDEGLKSLLMSWYYAGYYTGLYEGRQEAKTSIGTNAKPEA